MTHTDQPSFALLMTSIAELYGKPLSKPLLDIYWRCLEAYPLEKVRAALKTHVLHPDCGQFMPKPADLVRHINGSSETQGLQAWHKVLQAIRVVGSYQSVVFDDPLIHVVITDLGGWLALCQQKTKTLTFVGKEFEKLYARYLTQPPSHYPKQLTGLIEQCNTRAGYPYHTVHFFGDKSKALQVWQHGCQPEDYVTHLTKVNTSLLSVSADTLNPLESAAETTANHCLPLAAGDHDGAN